MIIYNSRNYNNPVIENIVSFVGKKKINYMYIISPVEGSTGLPGLTTRAHKHMTIRRPCRQFRGVTLSGANDRGKSHLRPRLPRINIIRKHANSLCSPNEMPKKSFLCKATEENRTLFPD